MIHSLLLCANPHGCGRVEALDHPAGDCFYCCYWKMKKLTVWRRHGRT